MTRTVTTLPVIEKTVGPLYNMSTHLGNWDATRKPITGIVIHTMVGTAEAAHTRFNNPASNVSAHYGVRLNGEIWHWVDEDKTAYHCGVYAKNQETIGVEHEDNGDYNGVRSDALYSSSSKLVAELCKDYNLPCNNTTVFGHKSVPYPTACPDALDISRIIKGAQAILNPPPPPPPPPVIQPASQPTPSQKGTFIDEALFTKLVNKSTSTDIVGTYLNFPNDVVDSSGFGDVAVNKIKQFQSAAVGYQELYQKNKIELGQLQEAYAKMKEYYAHPLEVPMIPQVETITPAQVAQQQTPFWARDLTTLVKQALSQLTGGKSNA